MELKQTNTQFIKLKALQLVLFLAQSLLSVLFKCLRHCSVLLEAAGSDMEHVASCVNV